MKFEFGEYIKVRTKLVRKSEYRDNIFYRSWQEKNIKSLNCIFLGYRTLSNGNIRKGYHNNQYIPMEYIKAALVCAEKVAPFYVPIESIEKELDDHAI